MRLPLNGVPWSPPLGKKSLLYSYVTLSSPSGLFKSNDDSSIYSMQRFNLAKGNSRSWFDFPRCTMDDFFLGLVWKYNHLDPCILSSLHCKMFGRCVNEMNPTYSEMADRISYLKSKFISPVEAL